MKKIIIFAAVLAAAAVIIYIRRPDNNTGKVYYIDIRRGDIEVTITAYGVVRPRNRLEIRPPLSGRIEEMLVSEGDSVESGDILAWMSSQDRAALMDIARSRGEEEVARWQDVYRRAPVVAHLSGFVIRRSAEPGQSVSSAEPVIVMADELILQAQVDETDIGKIRKGDSAVIRLDAYPARPVPGKIEHIAYESEVVNNVVVYKVDVRPLEYFDKMRSGMSAVIEISLEKSTDALQLPVSAVRRAGREAFVLLHRGNSEPERRPVSTGITDGVNIEIIEGLKDGDKVVYEVSGFIPDRAAERARSRGGLPGMSR